MCTILKRKESIIFGLLNIIQDKNASKYNISSELEIYHNHKK